MPKTLSGVQRQRVALGRATVRRPALFLFHQPLSNLDAALRAQVRVDIRKLHDTLATTSVYVTHDQVEAMTLADVMFVLNKGTVEQAGPPLEVYDKPKSRFVAGFLGSPAMNFLEGKVEGDHVRVVSADDDAGPTVPFAPAAKATEGRAVTVGVRPHDFEVGEGGLSLSVTYTEALGGETYAYGEVAGQSMVVRLEPHHRVQPGDVMPLRVDPERVQLFDADSGRSLRW
jgi:sn-glycerol 3-phosphate transport system ATP-binding protein/multiple sugar transport system ATP-binding protein